MSAAHPRLTPRPILRRVPDAVHGGPDGTEGDLPPVRADFSTSVNAFGPAPSVMAAVRASLDRERITAYPDPTCAVARTALASRDGVAPDDIAIGAGATELILAVTRAFVRAGDRVLVPPHAFGEYTRAALLSGGHVGVAADARPSPAPDASLDDAVASYVHAVVTRTARVAFLCTPESPSGRAWPRDAVREVARACRRAGTLLVLDQSFDAFTAAPLGTPALRDHPAVLHLRSLTKDHALAGLRVGYLAGPRTLVAAVERARMPWSVSAPAQAAALAACAPEADAHVRETAVRLRAAAAELAGAARDRGIASIRSDTHYFLLAVGDAAATTRALRERHALKVRDCTSFGLPAYVRVAARTPGDTRLLLTALAAVLPAERTPALPCPASHV
jgi:histidinol-phosphate/aromatic aminotransferase/cobyric acid decarboxylase-like protein